MTSMHHEGEGSTESSGADVTRETRELGRQYGPEYFSYYGRGPFSYQTEAPYRAGEPLWEGYFGQIADLIVTARAPTSVLDAGCAIGLLVAALREREVDAWGIDISQYAIGQVAGGVREFCSVASVTDELARDYDLIVCVEVLEHLPPHLATVAIANFSRHTDAVLFSASDDGFREPTHENVQPTDYWVELFGRHGFFRDLDVDASVVSPQAILFVRSGQSTVAVARAYERWHTRTLAELRDLRAARKDGAAEFVRAERATREVARLTCQLEQHKAVAERAQADLARILGGRTLRYTAPLRAVYGRLRRLTQGQAKTTRDGPRYSIEAPTEGQVVAADALLQIRGWVLCERGSLGRIDVFVNGVDCGKARLGVSRPDVVAPLDRPEAFVSGFERLVDLSALPLEDERVVVELWVETLGGDRHALRPVTLRLVTPGPDLSGADRMPLPEITRAAADRGDVRLLVSTHHLGLGGGQLYLHELLRLLSRKPGFDATLVAPFDGSLREATEALGIPVVISGPHPIGSIEDYEARQTEIEEWARREDFNAVLANTFGSFPAIDLADRLALPAVWAIHESFDVRSFWHAAYGSSDVVDPAVRARAEAALASAAAVVFEADATRELFVRHGEAERFLTVPYGIDVEEISRYAASVSRQEARRLLELPEGATILLCLGTVEPRKAQGALAEAFGTVAREHPEARLVFVGAGSDDSSKSLDNFVRASGLESRIQIVSATPDIYAWYRACDALVCASDVESLPRTVLEAMAFAVPVIATRVFGLPELIEDGVTGYLCEPRDIGELVNALNRFLATSAEERGAVGRAGNLLVRERHDSRGYADAYDRLLRSLIEDPRRLPTEILRSDETPVV